MDDRMKKPPWRFFCFAKRSTSRISSVFSFDLRRFLQDAVTRTRTATVSSRLLLLGCNHCCFTVKQGGRVLKSDFPVVDVLCHNLFNSCLIRKDASCQASQAWRRERHSSQLRNFFQFFGSSRCPMVLMAFRPARSRVDGILQVPKPLKHQASTQVPTAIVSVQPM